jgi:hypothetical protein
MLENLASILELDEQLNEFFNIYSDAPENDRKKEAAPSGGSGILASLGLSNEDGNFFI